MAVYDKLLLSTGGGIVSHLQQADQAPNTASLLIGLGGTGISCLRVLKTQVYSRLKPDNPEEPSPKYRRIRFLGVDTDSSMFDGKDSEAKSSDDISAEQLMPITRQEFFDISVKDIDGFFESENEPVLLKRKDLRWLRWREIPKTQIGDKGAGGVRQAGRFMLMEKSNAFLQRIESELRKAKLNLDKDASVNVHIFTGLSGGTGAGCFLDVCYLVRQAARNVGGAVIFGYFFLPDVNLARIPEESVLIRANVKANGYASMQELDYCMQLEYNGGTFVQMYKGDKAVPWNGPPVDMPHLICAKTASGKEVPNAYDYAMSATAEYVMDFLTMSENSDSFGISSHLANFQAQVDGRDRMKDCGANVSYLAIGASCASLPMRQINTFLASHLFEGFKSVSGRVPTSGDVNGLAGAVFGHAGGSFEEVYRAIVREVCAGATPDYPRYPNNWQFVRDHGRGRVLEHYYKERSAKLGRVVRNIGKLTTPENENSYLARLDEQLTNVARDLRYGPSYAYGLLAASNGYSLVNYIDGLIGTNREQWNFALAQVDRVEAAYKTAEIEFDASLKKRFDPFGKEKEARFKQYLDASEELVTNQYWLPAGTVEDPLGVYELIDRMLKTFRTQVEEGAASYYGRLNEVVTNLVTTFGENVKVLASEKALQSNGTFVKPLVSMSDLKSQLTQAVSAIHPGDEFRKFVAYLQAHNSDWESLDSDSICQLVTEYFVNGPFKDFATRSVNEYLSYAYREKYRRDPSEVELAQYVHDEWIEMLTKDAQPLFAFKSGSGLDDTGKLAFVSIPRKSAAIAKAVESKQEVESLWAVKESALSDRIYVMYSAAAFPLSDYRECNAFEDAFFTSSTPGRHYYEGRPYAQGAQSDTPFDDWSKLPPLTPQSKINLEGEPKQIQAIVGNARSLFDRAVKAQVIAGDGKVMAPSKRVLDTLEELGAEARGLAGSLSEADLPHARNLLTNLDAIPDLAFQETGLFLKSDGRVTNEEEWLTIAEDHLTYAPAIQMRVEQILASLEKADALITVRDELSDAVRRVEGELERRDLEDYLQAFYTGVVFVDGFTVSIRLEDPLLGANEVELSSADATRYPYGMTIPFYQGFLSYRQLSSEKKELCRTATATSYGDYTLLAERCAWLERALDKKRLAGWNSVADSDADAAIIKGFLRSLAAGFITFRNNLPV